MKVYFDRLHELISEGTSIREIVSRGFALVWKSFLRYETVIFEILYSFCLFFGNKFVKEHKSGNKEDKAILIILPTALGDTIVSMQTFSLIDEWCAQNNRKVIVVCRDIAELILTKYAHCKNLTYYVFKDENRTSFRAYKKMVSYLKDFSFEKIVVCDIPIRGRRLLPMCLQADEKVFYGFKMGNSDFFDHFQIEHVFDKAFSFPQDTFYMKILRQIATDIGVDEYSISIFTADKLKSSSNRNTKEYVLICPEASCVERSLDANLCDMLIHEIRKKKDIEIVVSISGRNEEYTQKIADVVEKNKVVSYIGNTTIDELFEIVANAKLVIGCDSGTVHVAAIYSVRSICIKGFWQSGYFQPYKLDGNAEFSPIVVYGKKYECSLCEERGEQRCNPKCKELVNNGNAYLCLSDYLYIMEKVIHAIEENALLSG